jgi:hypothetical protein
VSGGIQKVGDYSHPTRGRPAPSRPKWAGPTWLLGWTLRTDPEPRPFLWRVPRRRNPTDPRAGGRSVLSGYSEAEWVEGFPPTLAGRRRR